MSEYDEQNIIAEQPTLLERLRLTDPEAAQTIERLERERDELDAVVEQRNAECSRNFKELAAAQAQITRMNREGVDLSVEYDEAIEQLDDARAEIGQLHRTVRAIELRVDGLNTKGYPQKATTQGVLDRIKQHCREALATPAPGTDEADQES